MGDSLSQGVTGDWVSKYSFGHIINQSLNLKVYEIMQKMHHLQQNNERNFLYKWNI